MSDALTVVLGLGVMGGILTVILYNVKEEHEYLRFFLLLLLLTMSSLLLPQALWESKTTCEAVVNNSTVNASTTTYAYTSFCFTNSARSPGTIYTIFIWSYYLIMGCIILWMIVNAAKGLYERRVRK